MSRTNMNLDESCTAPAAISTSVVKEEVLQNNEIDASSSPGRSSPDTNCPICLGKLENKSFTDSCLHQFCFKCLLEWSKVKAECPLCKQSFKSIIHNVRSIEDYEQYYLSTTSTEGTLFVSQGIFARLESPDSTYREPPNYRFRTTAVSSYLDYFVRLEEAISHRVLPPGPSIRGTTLSQRYRQHGTSDFRRGVYQLGLWAQRTADITGRIRLCSPEFYRENPAQVHRLVPWLNRELNVLLYENSPHVHHVMSRVLELVTQVPIRSPGFAAVISPYIGRNTEHFIHEFHCFAISPYDLVGYDRHATYVGRSQISDDNNSHESDSDVQVLEEGAHSQSNLIQLVDSDSDDCIVLDVPSRPQPEVITLDSDDDEVVQINTQTNQPSQPTSSQTQSASTSTSQPKPSVSRRPRLKRNWVTVNNIQLPSTSKSENIKGCEISISIAHSSRSLSPSFSEDSSSSWVPVSRKPTRVKKKNGSKKSKSGKVKLSEVPTLKIVSESEDDSSPGPVTRRRASVALVNTSPENSDDEISRKVPKLPPSPRCERNLSPISSNSDNVTSRKVKKLPPSPRCERNLSPISSNSDRLFLDTDLSLSSSTESEYKPRLKSVVIKSLVKPEPRTMSPMLSPHYRSVSHDYSFSSSSYSDLPSCSRSRSDSYRSTQSRRSRRSTSSSPSPERLQSKRCKHSKKRSKREK